MDENAVLHPGALPDSGIPPAARPGFTDWLREGLRSAFFLQPRVAGQPTPAQVLALLVSTSLVALGLDRLEVPGAAYFDLSGWLTPWWTVGATVLLMWSLLWGERVEERSDRPRGLASWYALWIAGSLPAAAFGAGLAALRARELVPPALENSQVFAWATWLAIMAWLVAVPAVLAWRVGLRAPRLAAFTAGLVAIHWVFVAHFYERPWYPERSDSEETERFTLSQETFEKQQEAWRRAVAALAPQRPAVRDVYGLVFAPYASEDVFLRESTMVAQLLAERFDARGRVLHLANHRTTAERLPWATPQNLRRAVQALAARMDRERDVLVVYLTSHGASNFRLAATHWPLKVDGIAPVDLQRALDESGIRHRVIAISACYSGGWVGPLAGDTSLVMTAADPENTSYGCGRRSELTFFGRAVFNEQLRTTHSFERAFAAAVPVIRQRELEAGKEDFSNPQISVGAKIRPVLEELEQRLHGAPPP